MDELIFSRAADFIWKNARLLDRRLFAFDFLDGSAEAVVSALAAYQNADGGFGNALEPDKRTPYSTPVDVQVAFELLDRIGMMGDADVQRRLVLPACDFLTSITTPQGGVPFSLPLVNPYPHAPWWQVDGAGPAQLNPTAAIAGLLLKHGIQHAWLAPAVEFCRAAIDASETTQYHDLLPMVELLAHDPQREWAEGQLARIRQRVLASDVVTYDPAAQGYVQFPLDWAGTPRSWWRGLFSDEALRADLARLAQAQQPDGGWPIGWEPVGPGVVLEWRGWVTVQALHTLKAYQSISVSG